MVSELNQVIDNAKLNISKILQFTNVFVVLGNETCDLDSAISSLTYSMLLYNRRIKDGIVIPVFNIQRLQLPVKTEVNYFLRKYNVNVDKIVCRDNIDLDSIHKKGSLKLILLDHHVLEGEDKKFKNSVVTVIDHRPQDPAWLWSHIDLTLQVVGSCATLVTEKLLTEAPQLISSTIAILLLGTILLDTSCLSAEVGRATPLDTKIVNQLGTLCTKKVNYQELFSELQRAKSDISSLTSAQLLMKDLKITSGIPIVGLPIKVKEFLKRSDASSAVRDFCSQHSTQVCVLYGMEVSSGSVTRDIAVYTPSNAQVASEVLKVLKESKDPDLQLQELTCPLDGFKLFDQLNIKATRKQLLPLVRHVKERP